MDRKRRRSSSPSSSKRENNTSLSGAERKRLKEEKKRLKVESYFGYTNDNNVFGDRNLTSKFVWNKKVDHDKDLGKKVDLSKKSAMEKRFAKKHEIDKVKERRREREEEKVEREREREEEDRLRMMMEYGDMGKKEEEFLITQEKTRSKIRIAEGRERPIDILAKNVWLFEGDEEDEDVKLSELDLSLEVGNPNLIFQGLSFEDLKELHECIVQYKEIQKDTAHCAFWDALLVVGKDYLEQARGGMNSAGSGMHNEVREELMEMFEGKSAAELHSMTKDIKADLDSGEGDVEYWESVLKECEISMARARLNEIHLDMLKHQLEKLKKQKSQSSSLTSLSGTTETNNIAAEEGELNNTENENEVDDDNDGGVSPELIPFGEEDGMPESYMQMEAEENFGPGPLSPRYITEEEENDILEGEIMVDPEVDERNLLAARAVVLARIEEKKEVLRIADGGMSAVAVSVFEEAQKKKMEDGEEQLEEEVALSGKSYEWEHKYKARKPRYLNRVKTGYAWSQYNRTHYDYDNPPPKSVLGYKFNIFYPDLIDKTKTPTFFIEPASTNEFCIIRFHAGPPYEDIAFKIVNQEWSKGKKHGYKCVFERGVLNVYVNFKRHFYRR